MFSMVDSAIGVVVPSRVLAKRVRSSKSLAAASDLAGVRLLLGVGLDVSRLMFLFIEGSIQ